MKAEQNGKLLEQWSAPLILTVLRENTEMTPINLSPPLDFNIVAVSPIGAFLEWSPSNGNISGYFLRNVQILFTFE